MAEGKTDAALKACDAYKGPTAAMVKAAILRWDASQEELAKLLENAALHEIARLERWIWVLALVSNIAPILGFLGTVVGMIQSFNTIERTGGFAKPAELAGGISKALITTCLGLIVAIPALVVYVYFRNKIEQLSGEVAEVGEELMKPIRMRALREAEDEAEE